MRKIIAAMNMSLDGFCDHTALTADDEIHDHYNQLLRNAGTILYGRITYQLMEYWRDVVKNPTGVKSMDDFAVTMDMIPKVVFSKTLKNVDWKTARLAKRDLKEEVEELKQSANGDSKDILVGSPGLIVALSNLDLIDEFQICIQPIILGTGLTLFLKNINHSIGLKLVKTKTFSCGAILLYYQRSSDGSNDFSMNKS